MTNSQRGSDKKSPEQKAWFKKKIVRRQIYSTLSTCESQGQGYKSVSALRCMLKCIVVRASEGRTKYPLGEILCVENVPTTG